MTFVRGVCMDMNENTEMINELALHLLKQAQNTVLLNMSFTVKALGSLEPFRSSVFFGTDGRFLYYEPVYILKLYRKSEKALVHSLMHSLMHCIFRHWSFAAEKDEKKWSLACDIACEAILFDFEFSFYNDEYVNERLSLLGRLENEIPLLTAQSIYSYLISKEISENELSRLKRVFEFDDHLFWFKKNKKRYEDEEKYDVLHIPSKEGKKNYDDKGKIDSGSTDNASGNEKTGENESSASKENGKLANETEETDFPQVLNSLSDPELKKLWTDISKEIRSELEHFGKKAGDSDKRLIKTIESVNRETQDYTAFLKRFAVTREVLRPDLDSFDPGFYSYGLELYGNVALIEPNEYKQSTKIRDFVIAIDTSGSVSTDLIKKFLAKTYNILKNSSSFFEQTNIHIIQCDNDIREIKIIKELRDIDKYIESFVVRGMGGTDFRPVFEYVNEALFLGKLKNLKGLIYFTDGFGEYPKNKPGYESVFVFTKSAYDAFDLEGEKLPNWAAKLIIDEV